jgi:hypothetical protein
MINGFVLDIINENTEDITVLLFTNKEIPSGVTITAKNTNYDYSSLFLMSIKEGFMGGGISTDNEHISRVTIFKNNNPCSYEFHKIIDNLEIIIDGQNNYIAIEISPSSKSLVQLIPTFK